MKLENSYENRGRGLEVIARFGKAALVRLPNGTWQLLGGTEEDRHSAREWVSLFQHEAVVQFG